MVWWSSLKEHENISLHSHEQVVEVMGNAPSQTTDGLGPFCSVPLILFLFQIVSRLWRIFRHFAFLLTKKSGKSASQRLRPPLFRHVNLPQKLTHTFIHSSKLLPYNSQNNPQNQPDRNGEDHAP
jgi:hypothetical protein